MRTELVEFRGYVHSRKAAALRRVSQQTGKSMSALMREAIEKVLEKYNARPPTAP